MLAGCSGTPLKGPPLLVLTTVQTRAIVVSGRLLKLLVVLLPVDITSKAAESSIAVKLVIRRSQG